MATNFGFIPVSAGKRYFVSYKSEDTERVGAITRLLNQMGVPMWYDYGIEKGERWSAEINKNIQTCEAVILFATKAMFAVEDTYVRIEYRLAIGYKKKIYVVWLDDVGFDDVNNAIKDWYLYICDRQGIKVNGAFADKIAWTIVNEFHLVSGCQPQPTSSIYHPIPFETPLTPQPLLQPQLNMRVEDKLQFGKYPQSANGKVAPLVWRVLDVQNDKALLITDQLVDCILYNTTRTDITWEKCKLRKWLNHEFMRKAFSSEQQSQIVMVTNQNPNNPAYNTNGGNATQDKIFALSIDEAEKYFHSDDDRMAVVTEYAKKRGSYINDNPLSADGGKTGWWWLRSPGNDSCDAAGVSTNGCVREHGYDVRYNGVSVRPALWLNL